MKSITILSITLLLTAEALPRDEPTSDSAFDTLGERYLEQFAAFSRVRATGLGDHRFDGQLDEISEDARAKRKRWIQDFASRLERIRTGRLSRANQVDYALFKHALEAQHWRLTELREWAWNPLIYTGLSGDSIYGLMARDFAPEQERLKNVANRLEQFPRFLKQVRATLEAADVPAVHAETAVAQNRGVLEILDNMVKPHMSTLPKG